MKAVDIDLTEYTYELPEDKIAKHPLEKRDSSKLLIFKNADIRHYQFKDITDHLPEKSLIFFNNTKVIPARLIFQKETGARIEIFLLEPVAPSRVISEAMASKNKVSWTCMVGNAKKWKEDQSLKMKLPIGKEEILLEAKWKNKRSQEIELTWNGELTFSELVDAAGRVPLPPYINREVTDEDKPRYQTVYSKIDGAVAAPTAGLHFTDQVLNQLKEKQIQKDELTLHVSAGTFQPIKAASIEDHPMHSEQIIVTKENVQNIIDSHQVTAVGTTSMRTLESLYWYGVKLEKQGECPFQIEKLYPYEHEDHLLPDLKTSMQTVLKMMEKHGLNSIIGHTEIFIFPGYQFRVCDGLITNFHLPGSTLILLVAAFVGEHWKDIYQSALKNNYRFLSYGDSSLLLRT